MLTEPFYVRFGISLKLVNLGTVARPKCFHFLAPIIACSLLSVICYPCHFSFAARAPLWPRYFTTIRRILRFSVDARGSQR